MDSDGVHDRKKRRRSVRNLRRQSDFGALNLNVDPEENIPDDGSSVAVSNIDVYGSVWKESPEPVVKKRRRRSSLIVGLAQRLLSPEKEEPNETSEETEFNSAQASKSENLISNQSNEINAQACEYTDLKSSETKHSLSPTGKNGHRLENSFNISHDDNSETILDDKNNDPRTPGNCKKHNDYPSPQLRLNKSSAPQTEDAVKLLKDQNCLNSDKLNQSMVNSDTLTETADIDSGLNISNQSNISQSPAIANTSKVSPSSMSPDFPMSPSSLSYLESQEESYIVPYCHQNKYELGECDLEFTGPVLSSLNLRNSGKLESNENKTDHTNVLNCTNPISPDTKNRADLSLSDKENSIVDENYINNTPLNNDKEGSKVSPGFMDLCKAFAGKVANFVRTSPSYLTGSVLDSKSIVGAAALIENNCQNLVANELNSKDIYTVNKVNTSVVSVAEDGGYEIRNLDSDEIEVMRSDKKVNHCKLIRKEIDAEDMRLSQLNAIGSSKKRRDRKTFDETFNAVSNELKKNGGKCLALSLADSETDKISQEIKKNSETETFNNQEQVSDTLDKIKKRRRAGGAFEEMDIGRRKMCSVDDVNKERRKSGKLEQVNKDRRKSSGLNEVNNEKRKSGGLNEDNKERRKSGTFDEVNKEKRKSGTFDEVNKERRKRGALDEINKDKKKSGVTDEVNKNRRKSGGLDKVNKDRRKSGGLDKVNKDIMDSCAVNEQHKEMGEIFSLPNEESKDEKKMDNLDKISKKSDWLDEIETKKSGSLDEENKESKTTDNYDSTNKTKGKSGAHDAERINKDKDKVVQNQVLKMQRKMETCLKQKQIENDLQRKNQGKLSKTCSQKSKHFCIKKTEKLQAITVDKNAEKRTSAKTRQLTSSVGIKLIPTKKSSKTAEGNVVENRGNDKSCVSKDAYCSDSNNDVYTIEELDRINTNIFNESTIIDIGESDSAFTNMTIVIENKEEESERNNMEEKSLFNKDSYINSMSKNMNKQSANENDEKMKRQKRRALNVSNHIDIFTCVTEKQDTDCNKKPRVDTEQDEKEESNNSERCRSEKLTLESNDNVVKEEESQNIINQQEELSGDSHVLPEVRKSRRRSFGIPGLVNVVDSNIVINERNNNALNDEVLTAEKKVTGENSHELRSDEVDGVKEHIDEGLILERVQALEIEDEENGNTSKCLPGITHRSNKMVINHMLGDTMLENIHIEEGIKELDDKEKLNIEFAKDGKAAAPEEPSSKTNRRGRRKSANMNEVLKRNLRKPLDDVIVEEPAEESVENLQELNDIESNGFNEAHKLVELTNEVAKVQIKDLQNVGDKETEKDVNIVNLNSPEDRLKFTERKPEPSEKERQVEEKGPVNQEQEITVDNLELPEDRPRSRGRRRRSDEFFIPSTLSCVEERNDENLESPVDKPKPKSRGRPRKSEVRQITTPLEHLENIVEDESEIDKTEDTVRRKARRKSADAATLRIQMLSPDDSGNMDGDSSLDMSLVEDSKRGKKRKFKEETYEEIEKIYRNKNFVKPEEKKPWQTVLESPNNAEEVFGKKRLIRHIEFEKPSQMKLRKRLQKAVKNGWDPKKRKRQELKDDYVKTKLANIWSELDDDLDEPDSLKNKLKSIIETA